MRPFLRLLSAVCGVLALAVPASGQEDPRNLFITGHYEDGVFQSTDLANEVVGALLFYNSGFFGQRSVIANVEGGHIWSGHEVFDRSGLDPGLGVSPAVTQFVSGTGVVGQTDYHATLVGHILGGTGYIDTENGGSFTYVGIGLAPYAEMWSGAIATSFSGSDIGSFETTTDSVLTPYRAFFRGIEGRKADVINSSWGGADTAATSDETQTLDALALENSTVAFVVAAGNSGTAPVSAPGSAYNNITVGALGGADFLTPSEFSSRQAVDFYNPVSGTTTIGVRSAVDLAAPAENMFLAAYLGPTGSLETLDDITEDPSPDDLYFLNQDGTSFAAPIVSGGIALLKDVVHSYENTIFEMPATALDTRVVKSVLMAGAQRTVGWDNGQRMSGLVVSTTQSLDYATGAGALDLEQTANIYLLSETMDVVGIEGGEIGASGWDFATVALGGANEYRFTNPFDEPVELTISLNWFAGTGFDEDDLGEALSFADLNLELWLLEGDVFTTQIAESVSVYNNTEFLRLTLALSGEYGIRVTFLGLVYDVQGLNAPTDYGLAWQAQAVPEPSLLALLGVAGIVILFVRRRCMA